MSFGHLLEALAENRIPVFYDGQNVRLRPLSSDVLTDELRAAVTRYRTALVWMCLHRVRPDWAHAPWEFWFEGWTAWVDFQVMKARIDK